MVVSFGFFLLSVVEITTQAQIFAPNTYFPSSDDIEEPTEENLQVEYLSNANLENKFNEFTESTIDKSGFYIRVDKINLFKAVVKDVDPRYKDVYQKSWEKGVSHGKFTSYPDKNGITYLFAHAVGNKSVAEKNNAWFSNMDMLYAGDEVILYYEGTKYIYEVSDIIVVSPDASGMYTGVAPIQKIRLQFCGPPTGSLATRTLIDAVLMDKVVL